MSYHTVYFSWNGPSVVCYLFLHLFICAPTIAFTCCQHFVHYISLVLFTFLRTPYGCRVSFLKGTYNFQIVCKGMCTLKCTEKRLITFTPLHFLPQFVPHTEFKGSPEFPLGMYSTIGTSFRNYASISLQVPSNLSILLDRCQPQVRCSSSTPQRFCQNQVKLSKRGILDLNRIQILRNRMMRIRLGLIPSLNNEYAKSGEFQYQNLVPIYFPPPPKPLLLN